MKEFNGWPTDVTNAAEAEPHATEQHRQYRTHYNNDEMPRVYARIKLGRIVTMMKLVKGYVSVANGSRSRGTIESGDSAVESQFDERSDDANLGLHNLYDRSF